MLSRLDWLAVTRQAATLHHFDYRYNDDSNRIEKKVLGVPEVYTPDPLHRLETATRGGNLVERYGYDPVGNRKSTLAVPDPADWVYSERNELQRAGTANMQYDRNGNLVRKEDASGIWTYEWDVENRLARVTRDGYEAARFEYDPLGRRIEKVASFRTTRYGYDGEDIVRETFHQGFPEGPQIEYEHHYVHGPGVDEPLAVFHRDGDIWYYNADGLGSIVGATDETGAVAQSRSYDAFGNVQTGAQDPGYAFTGREWTPEVGLYYYRARYYDPKIGRFVSEDPIRFSGGVNFYAYVENNAPIATDPEGLAVRVDPGPPPQPPTGSTSVFRWWWYYIQLDGWVSRQDPMRMALSLPGPCVLIAPGAVPVATTFVGQARGPSIQIPPGSTMAPARGNGVVYYPPGGGQIRIMGPTRPNAPYAYPDGYVRIQTPNGQYIDPTTCLPGPPAATHCALAPVVCSTPNP